jgi:hypothetical protein
MYIQYVPFRDLLLCTPTFKTSNPPNSATKVHALNEDILSPPPPPKSLQREKKLLLKIQILLFRYLGLDSAGQGLENGESNNISTV